MYPYRIFVSYAHFDHELAYQIFKHLKSLGMVVVWDKAFQDGTPITQTIIDLIPRAHVFIPVITHNSYYRPWVHQETGLAIGLNVPCLPVVTDPNQIPEGMISDLKAVALGDTIGTRPDFTVCLPYESIQHKAEHGLLPRATPYDIADHADRRVDLIANYAEDAYKKNAEAAYEPYRSSELRPGRLRLDAALSSFSIPDAPPDAEIWDKYDGKVRRTHQQREFRWRERKSLEKHARDAGCDMVIHPWLKLESNGEEARKTRLRILVDFLKGKNSGKVRVVVKPKVERRNTVIVGDHFSAVSESPRPGIGYRHTTITWHAASVLKQLRSFDESFKGYFKDKMTPEKSRLQAIRTIKRII